MIVQHFERLGACIGFESAQEIEKLITNANHLLKLVEGGKFGGPPYVWNFAYSADRLEDDIALQYIRVLKVELRNEIASHEQAAREAGVANGEVAEQALREHLKGAK